MPYIRRGQGLLLWKVPTIYIAIGHNKIILKVVFAMSIVSTRKNCAREESCTHLAIHTIDGDVCTCNNYAPIEVIVAKCPDFAGTVPIFRPLSRLCPGSRLAQNSTYVPEFS